MQKIPHQFRYYQKKPEISNTKPIEFTDGNLFANFPRISQIGIQTLPGVQFKLNNSNNWIEVGETGIYELDLTGIGNIRNIIFNNDSINTPWETSTEKAGFFILVDIIYKDEDKSSQAVPLDQPCIPEDFEIIIHGGDADNILVK